MQKIAIFFVVLFVAFALSGCWKVSGTKETASNVTGDVWYVKTKSILGLIPFKSEVYYCPQPKTKGPAVCKKAKIHEPKESGYEQPPSGYPPRQPVYQQGQQPPKQQQGTGWQQGQQPQQQQGRGWQQGQQPQQQQQGAGWQQGQQPQQQGGGKAQPAKKRRKRSYQAAPPPPANNNW